MGSQLLGPQSYLCHLTYSNQIHHCYPHPRKEEACFMVDHVPATHKVPSLHSPMPPGFLATRTYANMIWYRVNKFCIVTKLDEGKLFTGSITLPDPRGPNNLWPPMQCICSHHLTKSKQIRHNNRTKRAAGLKVHQATQPKIWGPTFSFPSSMY